MSKQVVLLVVLLLIAGCVFGPFEITHEEGHLPKGRINISDDCKVRGNEKEARFVCKWYLDSMFSFMEK